MAEPECFGRKRLSAFSADGRREQLGGSFSDLLPPQGVVESFVGDQFGMSALFYELASFEDVDPLGVHDGGETVGNEDGHHVRAPADFSNGARDLFFSQ